MQQSDTKAPKPDLLNSMAAAATPAWADLLRRITVQRVPGISDWDFPGPQDGFGQLWHKLYFVEIDAVHSPEEVIRDWKTHFTDFWPNNNEFYAPFRGIRAGEIADISIELGPGMNLSTGLLIIQSNPVSFTFATPRDHMFAGWINFSAVQTSNGSTHAQVQALIRTNDPLYELAFRLRLGHISEDNFWKTTLTNVARFYRSEAEPEMIKRCVDPHVRWSNMGNLRYNQFLPFHRFLFRHSDPTDGKSS